MKELIQKKIRTVQTLKDVHTAMRDVFEEARTSNNNLGYVSGIITSDGMDFVQRNMQILADHTDRLRQENTFPIFSPTDVFTDEIFAQIDGFSLPQTVWLEFWEGILRMGYVTHIFMTPRWQKSSGARDEYRVAKEIGLIIKEV